MRPKLAQKILAEPSDVIDSIWLDLYRLKFDDLLGDMQKGFSQGFDFDDEREDPMHAPNMPKDRKGDRERAWFYQSVIDWFLVQAERADTTPQLPRSAICDTCDAILVDLNKESISESPDQDSVFKRALGRAKKSIKGRQENK